jgi:hypothetical protein
MPNRSHYIGTSRPQTGFFIREPISTTNTTYESSDDEDQLHAPVVPTFPTQSILTSVATTEIGQSSRGMVSTQFFTISKFQCSLTE